jgi:hypothetical protein
MHLPYVKDVEMQIMTKSLTGHFQIYRIMQLYKSSGLCGFKRLYEVFETMPYETPIFTFCFSNIFEEI